MLGPAALGLSLLDLLEVGDARQGELAPATVGQLPVRR